MCQKPLVGIFSMCCVCICIICLSVCIDTASKGCLNLRKSAAFQWKNVSTSQSLVCLNLKKKILSINWWNLVSVSDNTPQNKVSTYLHYVSWAVDKTTTLQKLLNDHQKRLFQSPQLSCGHKHRWAKKCFELRVLLHLCHYRRVCNLQSTM